MLYIFLHLKHKQVLPQMRKAKYKEEGNPHINLPGNFNKLDDFIVRSLQRQFSRVSENVPWYCSNQAGTVHSKNMPSAMPLGQCEAWHRADLFRSQVSECLSDTESW